MSVLRRSARARSADDWRLRIALTRMARQAPMPEPPVAEILSRLPEQEPVDAIADAVRGGCVSPIGNRRTIDVAREANTKEPKP